MLPDELKLALTSLVTFAVTEGLKVVSGWFGWDLSGIAAGIAAALTGAILLFADGLLASVPEQYKPTVTAILGLIVALLGAFGIHAQFKKMRPVKK